MPFLKAFFVTIFGKDCTDNLVMNYTVLPEIGCWLTTVLCSRKTMKKYQSTISQVVARKNANPLHWILVTCINRNGELEHSFPFYLARCFFGQKGSCTTLYTHPNNESSITIANKKGLHTLHQLGSKISGTKLGIPPQDTKASSSSHAW